MNPKETKVDIVKREDASQALTLELNEILKKRFDEQQDSDNFEEWLAENLGLNDETTFTLELQENDAGEVYIQFPDELILLLGWELDDDIEFEETDNAGFTLKNVTKQFRDAEEAWRNATSIDME
jgi:hypothetical protein